MKYIILTMMLILAFFRLENVWAVNNLIDAILLKNKSEPLIYEILGHLEYEANKGFVADTTMTDSISLYTSFLS